MRLPKRRGGKRNGRSDGGERRDGGKTSLGGAGWETGTRTAGLFKDTHAEEDTVGAPQLGRRGNISYRARDSEDAGSNAYPSNLGHHPIGTDYPGDNYTAISDRTHSTQAASTIIIFLLTLSNH